MGLAACAVDGTIATVVIRTLLTLVAMTVALGPAASADEPAPASPTAVTRVAPPRVPLQLVIDKAKVDLKGHRLELRASRDLVKVTVHVVGDSGAVLAHEVIDLASYRAGTPLVVGWTPLNDETVVRIEVFAYDADGYYKGIAITPWSVVIPHEEVNFRHDSSQIDESERPKLEASFVKVKEALAKHAEIGGVTLFVAGHTDTVGDAGYNLGLSRRRAQAIAKWFRQRGLTIPIAYEGFGESALLVKTADDVDEPRNRRADYILSVEEPVFKVSGYHPSWARIP
jgi:outer membrane protein OmpA-like peptidoglycan-associated protein